MRLYRRLLRLYPATFRARFEDEMLQAIHDYEVLDGRVPWTRVYGDLVTSAAVQRFREMSDMKTKISVALFALIAIGGASMMVTGVSFGLSSLLVTLFALACVGLTYALASLVARRGVRGAEYDYGTSRFRWWWPLAAALAIGEASLGIGQLVADPKPENLGALAAFGAFAALVIAGLLMRNRSAGNWMIATGVLPALGVFWMIVPAILALLVIVMALSDNIRMSSPRTAV